MDADSFCCTFCQKKDLQLFEQIDWVGNGPPIPEPRCGFRGEKCISELYLKNLQILKYRYGCFVLARLSAW